MKYQLLVGGCFLSVLFGAARADDLAVPADRKVRVICRYTKTYFDVPITLKQFPEGISPRAFLEAVAKQQPQHAALEWIGWFNVLRWDDGLQKYVSVERSPMRSRQMFLDRIQDGDVLLFNTPVCRFDLLPQPMVERL
jgi:hypothetical protein